MCYVQLMNRIYNPLIVLNSLILVSNRHWPVMFHLSSILFTFLFVSLFAISFCPFNPPFSLQLLSLFILFFPRVSPLCSTAAISSWFICNPLLRIINLWSTRDASTHILNLAAHVMCSAVLHGCKAPHVVCGLKNPTKTRQKCDHPNNN